MQNKAHLEADHFLNNETQFHLGMLPTEQANPKTRNLDKIFAESTREGVKALMSVDMDIYPMAQKVFTGKEYDKLVKAGVKAISDGKKIIFSGCGATGRLSILLESFWRCFFRDLHQEYPDIYEKVKHVENSVFSIMTGGDYALIRAVEYFEDYQEFGRQQARELIVIEGDILVAITEGGETSSVLGTLTEAADRGAEVFLMFNNPADILCKHIERSRKAIEDPRVTVLDLFCGPMAIAGSTRMQATTSEQLIAGAALESILGGYFRELLSAEELELLNIRETDYAEAYNEMLSELLSGQNPEIVGEYIQMEKNTYQENGLVTYYGNTLMLDIFTDTTERSPTFMLPPFRKYDDTVSPPSWAYVKNPLLPTPEAWVNVLERAPRCLEWDAKLYRKMNAPQALISDPPLLDISQILKFQIGNDEDNSRISKKPNVAVNVISRVEISRPEFENYQAAFNEAAEKYQGKSAMIIGTCDEAANYKISCSPQNSVFNLMDRLAVKIVLNTVSTGTMVVMGRVLGNWMSWVDVTNKKLKDRGIRLISDICGISYRDACYALHESLEELKSFNVSSGEKPSPVQYTINRIGLPGRSDIGLAGEKIGNL
ncbi:MAG: sugar phosphate isomerase [Bacteroidia bacterium]|nr:MAG: sugar phosphate isomerase [Bacteroidia bacterium]